MLHAIVLIENTQTKTFVLRKTSLENITTDQVLLKLAMDHDTMLACQPIIPYAINIRQENKAFRLIAIGPQ